MASQNSQDEIGNRLNKYTANLSCKTGFGSTSGGAFGAPKPTGFGTNTTSSGGGLFGNSTATAGGSTGGFGGFGSTTASTSSPFGGGSAGGGLFGSKPAFGSTPAPQANAFGGAATTSSPFGGGTQSAFGAPQSTALGGAVGECTGTGNVAFQAFVEKEPNSTSNQQNSFQSISFQQPYQKFSPEELRLADYAQGRKYGNSNGQAGAFGTSNFGGGFGSNTAAPANNTFGGASSGGGLFGGGGATSSPFGAAQPAQTGAFGQSATSGGLFGSAPKPATGGLFGSTPAPAASGGLFGNSTSAFGGGTTSGTAGGAFGQASNTAGSSLFGSSTTAAAKPFSFGSTQPASTGTGFGTSNTASTGFGGSSGLFGSTPQQTTTSFGQQPAAASTLFGGFGSNSTPQSGSSLFGNTQPKPAATGGLFGAPAASSAGGLFGSAPQANASTNAFGTSTNTSSAGGLFGSKPAAGGLFGSAPQIQGTSSGGLFGGGGFGGAQTQGQQTTSGGLFGNSQQKPGGLFGASTQQQGASSLFGNAGQQQQQGGLFGNSQQQQQQQPQNSLFGGGSSLFGTPQQGLTTSINDNAAYGSASLFGDLSATNMNNPGPVATPLSSVQSRSKRAAAIPITRLSSTSSPRYSTPQRKGFGFSYSTYASPSSVSSTSSTPGTFSNSTLGSGLSSFSRALTKSVSTSGLRNSYTASESILAPGAFSASPSVRSFGSTGSVKKLSINRSLRNDLFSPPGPQMSSRTPTAPTGSIMKKRVSFDSHTSNGVNGSSSSAEQAQPTPEPSPEELGLLRPRPQTNGSSLLNSVPETSQVMSNELAIVPEESTSSSAPPPVSSQKDKVPGDYWMSPSREDIEAMSRTQRQQVQNFTVGRNGAGQVRFTPPVDLSSINLDDIFGTLIQLDVRNATVYPDKTKKPNRGSGLNVPATISLENSWPRAVRSRGGSVTRETRMVKHISGLKKVIDTTFVEYNVETGVWTFTVDHFTTYSFPGDDEFEGEDDSEFGQSSLSLPPDTPAEQVNTPKPYQHDQSFTSTSQYSVTESDPDDTFQFKKKKILPGAFDEHDLYFDEHGVANGHSDEQEQSFLDDRSVGSQSEDGAEPMDQDGASYDDGSVSVVDQDMAGSYPSADNTTELENYSQNDFDGNMDTPGALTRARERAVRSTNTPSRTVSTENNWATALSKTVSPKKQDRALLKGYIGAHETNARSEVEAPLPRRVVTDGRGFANSIDLMNSLFGTNRSPVKVAKIPAMAKGFEVGAPFRC